MLKKFEKHLLELSHTLNEKVVMVSNSNKIPPHWQDYLSDSITIRKFGILYELSKIEQYFPVSMNALKQKIIDAFLFESEKQGICRAFVQLIDGKEYLLISNLPWKYKSVESNKSSELFKNNIHIALYWIYNNIMDGLTDKNGFCGFKPLSDISTISNFQYNWSEMDWYSQFSNKNNVKYIYEFLNSGGGGYLLLHLNYNWRNLREFKCFYVNVKDIETQPEQVNAFPYLDEWMAIGLAEIDLE